MKKRLLALGLMLAMTMSIFVGCSKEEEAYPNDTLTIICPWSVGGGLDVMVRKFAQVAEKHYGAPIIVENHTGASGTIAMSDLLSADADGYTMGTINGTLFSITPEYIPVDYTFDDVLPLSGIRTAEFIFVSNPDKTGIDSIETLKEYGKDHTVKFGTSGGPGNDQYTMAIAGLAMLGIEAEPVTYDGQGETLTALMGGHVDVIISSPPTYYDYERAGNVKSFASLTEEPFENEFGVTPTFIENGADISFASCDYFAVKAGTPDAIVEKLIDTIDKTYADEEYLTFMEEQGFEILDKNTEELKELVNDQIADMEVFLPMIK